MLLCHAGTAPNIARNAIVNCTELVTYDLIKDTLLKSTPLTGIQRLQDDKHMICPNVFLCGTVTFSHFPPQIICPVTSYQPLVQVYAQQ